MVNLTRGTNSETAGDQDGSKWPMGRDGLVQQCTRAEGGINAKLECQNVLTIAHGE